MTRVELHYSSVPTSYAHSTVDTDEYTGHECQEAQVQSRAGWSGAASVSGAATRVGQQARVGHRGKVRPLSHVHTHDMLDTHILRHAWEESAFGSRAGTKETGKGVKK
jgi:hypothetical protein